MTEFGSDASKPYPSPATTTFTTGAYTGPRTPAGATFSDGGATAIPRYPTNIFYNVSSNAQEVDEYETVYDSPTCVPISGVTTCNPAGTTFTIAQIIASIDQGMFQHMMGNDPRPHYFHQTNLMSQTNQGATGNGDGLFYETVNPLLSQYRQYFASNAPIEQLTMPQIGTLLDEQSGWAAANASQVTGSIQGHVVTVVNGGSAIEIPLTGTTVGSPYAGSQSGWVLAPSGTSTYTALAAWPAPPTVPVVVTPPGGPAPGTPGKKLHKAVPASVIVQVAPKTVHVKRGNKVTVSLKCKAAKGKVCTGSFKLQLMGQTAKHKLRIKAGKIARVAVKLPKRARQAIAKASKDAKASKAKASHLTLNAKLVISTAQPHGKAKVTRGALKIRP